jgi:hypothetical protein
MKHPHRHTLRGALANGGPLYHTKPPHWSNLQLAAANLAFDVAAWTALLSAIAILCAIYVLLVWPLNTMTAWKARTKPQLHS